MFNVDHPGPEAPRSLSQQPAREALLAPLPRHGEDLMRDSSRVRGLSSHQVLSMQRRVGNGAMVRLLKTAASRTPPQRVLLQRVIRHQGRDGVVEETVEEVFTSLDNAKRYIKPDWPKAT